VLPQGVILADDAFVVFDKPAGLPAVPGRTPELQDCAASRMLALFTDARVVHRLDMPTSGLLLFARGAEMQRRLSAAFERREVHKRYEAWVHGLVRENTGAVSLPLAADWPARPRQRVDEAQGKAAHTEWQILVRDTAQQRTRLALFPHTGRTHQLRVHMMAIGHPIIGDTLYGPEPTAHVRLLLHATQLSFNHPVTSGGVVVESPAPF
jgi:tRNA pseudouridine32 synthase / 23S rRNA pseudouridine746 synthase